MKLPISQLVEGENRFHFNSAKETWLRDILTKVAGQGPRVTQGMDVKIKLTKLEPDYYMRGEMDFEVEQACSRCAEAFTMPIRHAFDVALAHLVPGKHGNGTSEAESEELDVNFFGGNEIDLAPVIEEQFFLSLPFQSICREDCRGICQQCGANLNTGSCLCRRDQRTTPFSVLKDLKPGG